MGFERKGSFFRAKKSVSQKKEPVFIDVGGYRDCGFTAVAAGVLNKILYSNDSCPEVSAVLENHFTYFPKDKEKFRKDAQGRFLIPFHPHVFQLMENLAYTLRQMAVDRMVAFPQYYRDAFSHETGDVSPDQLRHQSSWFPQGLEAVAAETGLPIEVRITTPEKCIPLRLQLVFQDTSTKPIIIHSENNRFKTEVEDAHFFQVGRTLSKMEPVKIHQNEPGFKDILAIIKKDEERLEAAFIQAKKRLNAAVIAGEIETDKLLDVWVTLPRQAGPYAGTQHGSEHFFNALNRPDLQGGPHRITAALIDAFARSIALGQVDETAVFEKIEQLSQKASHRI